MQVLKRFVFERVEPKQLELVPRRYRMSRIQELQDFGIVANNGSSRVSQGPKEDLFFDASEVGGCGVFDKDVTRRSRFRRPMTFPWSAF